jgi:TonB-linked SusC/RagA family outer membrane protein
LITGGFLALYVFAYVDPAWAQAQSYTLEGRVIEADTDRALPGANVQVEATTFGTATREDGGFSLSVRLAPGTYTLRVSFVGYRTEQQSITLDDQQTVSVGTVALEPGVAGLEEVVVTGTGGPTERRQLGNAISSVDAQELEEAPSSSTLQSLQGKIAGAQIQQNSGNPAGGISVRLRGTSTVLGSADPLFVIDGVIVSNDSPELILLGGGSQNRLVDINPNDIARIEVVKGAAAAALYGSRANNGVVQIFTKKGQQGAPRVTFSTRIQTDAVRKTLDVNRAQNDQGQFIDNAGDPLPEGQQRWDWQDFIFDRAFGTEQYLSIAGGSGETRYFTSGSHFVNEGIVEGNRFRRINGYARVQQTVADWINLTAGARFVRSRSDDVPNGGLNSNYGSLTGFIFGPNTFDPRPEGGEYPNQGTLANPIEVIDRYDFTQETQRFIGDVQLDLVPTENLSINYILGLDTYDQVAKAFIPRGTSAPGFGTGFSRRAEQSLFQLNNDLTIRYQRPIWSGIESTTLVGATLQYESNESFNAQSQDLAPISEVVQSGTASRAFGEFRGETVIYGIFGQQSFGVADRFFLTGAARFDASSSFSEDNRWQFYPKVSSSYVLSEHTFWQDAVGDVIPSFRLRASLGFSGGLTAIGPFTRFTNYGVQPFNGNPGLQPSNQLGAIEVVPERQREIEVGTDFSLLSDRVSVELTYYNQHTTDLLLSRTIAPTTGFGSQLANIGTMDNTGIELRLQGIPVARDPFRWTSTVTYTRNRNEVSGIPQQGGEEATIIFGSSFGLVAARNDEPIGVFFGDAFERNEEGDVVDVNGNPLERGGDGYWRLQDGTPSEEGDGVPAEAAEDRIIGDPNPDFTASWINRFELGRNLSIRAQFDAVVGQDVFNFTRRLAALSVFGTLEDYERELEGDLPSGYNAAVFGIFENWVEEGSFIKLREVAVNYTLSTPQLPFENVRFNLAGRNLFSIDDYSGYDPEINVAGQRTAVRNFDFVEVPIPRSFTLGATLTF